MAQVECAAILAGGRSSRMGREKALLRFEGQTLVARTAQFLRPLFKRVVVVTSNPEVGASAQLPFIPDQFAGYGPLGGIQATLHYFEAPTFVVACDMPFLNRAFIQEMATFFAENETAPNALVPRGENGIEPLHAIYSPSCLPVFERLLGNDVTNKMPSMRAILSEINAQFVPEEAAKSHGVRFENWNTPDDLRGAI